MTGRDRAAALAAAFRARPEVARFAAALTGARASGGVRAARRLLADLGWLDALLAELISASRADPWFSPPFPALGGSIRHGLRLIDLAEAQVGVDLIPAVTLEAHKRAGGGAGSIGFTGHVQLYRVLRGSARLSLWRGERIRADFTAAARPPCRWTGACRIAAGDWLLVDGRRDGFIVERIEEDLVWVQATLLVDAAPLKVEHDARNLAFTAASATDRAASHLQVMASVLRVLGHGEAAPALAALAGHPAFYLRWHAVRELAGVDAAAAGRLARRMAIDDPHPDVRAGAARLTAVLPC